MGSMNIDILADSTNIETSSLPNSNSVFLGVVTVQIPTEIKTTSRHPRVMIKILKEDPFVEHITS